LISRLCLYLFIWTERNRG